MGLPQVTDKINNFVIFPPYMKGGSTIQNLNLAQNFRPIIIIFH